MRFFTFTLLFLMAACSPVEQPFHTRNETPELIKMSGGEDAPTPPGYHRRPLGGEVQINQQFLFRSSDGALLPLRVWPAKKPRAVLIALHGMNDYSHAFDAPARFFASRGITTYAYDQRGFGAGPQPGIWPGAENLKADARAAVQAARVRHPRLPVFVLGESMGGAVALSAFSDDGAPEISGVILSAPAVWGAEDFNPFLRAGLWLAAHTFPAYAFTGEDAEIQASDNIEMLRALSRDPLVLKSARVDAMYGMVQLMDAAHRAAPALTPRVLLLYGARDQVIPPFAVFSVGQALPSPKHVTVYPDGWHLLLRDVQAKTVWRDVAAWMLSPAHELPSGFAHPEAKPAFDAAFGAAP